MNLYLCEHASCYPDGTFTIVRGGIEFWTGHGPPVRVQLTLVAIVEPYALDEDEQHPLEVSVDPLGVMATGMVAINDETKELRVAIPLAFATKGLGTHTISCRIGKETGSIDLDVRPACDD